MDFDEDPDFALTCEGCGKVIEGVSATLMWESAKDGFKPLCSPCLQARWRELLPRAANVSSTRGRT